jgi:uracil-DNA glycosylase
MKYERLVELNDEIRGTARCKEDTPPVINDLRPSQRYLIISSDPSSDTDKDKEVLEKHSGFEERVIALVFFGSDDAESLEKIRADYQSYKDKFLNNFYWTHYSKCYAQGNPDSFWADKFLKEEIELFEPELIIIFGSKPADFLFGKGKLKDRVNTVMEYESIPTICCLHPSRDWNMFRREEYEFAQTWVLIRSRIDLK